MTREYMKKLARDECIMTDAAKIEELQAALRQAMGIKDPRVTRDQAKAPSRLYVASKVKHADMWREFRDTWGAPIISTWIDEAEEGQTADYRELAERCVREVQSATAVILYCQPGEVLEGALLEVGAALAFGIPVYCVGTCDSLSRVFTQHPDWHACETVSGAVSVAHGKWRGCA